jgi:hypothetical protein
MKDEKWALIVHSILMLKCFTLHHLRSVTCDRGNNCKAVLRELKSQGYVVRRSGEFHLTQDVGKRFELLNKVRAKEGR